LDRSSRVTPDERKRTLDELAAEIAACTRCPLHKQRMRAVPGDGHADTEVVFVGEGPGYNEDREGRPFVGQAGGLLNELLGQIGWRRDEVFITNVVKCRPPGNRDPEPSEIAACAPYLKRQLEVLDPAVVVTLGRHSLQTFMPGARISAAHGTTRATDPQTGANQAVTYAMYHPAAALRQHSLKETMLTDMCGLPDVLIEARRTRSTKPGEPPTLADASAGNRVPTMATEPEMAPITEQNLEPQPTVLVEAAPAPEPEFAVQTLEEPVAIEEAVAVGAAAPAANEPQLELFG
jgi:uracil-DNA glycosylase